MRFTSNAGRWSFAVALSAVLVVAGVAAGQGGGGKGPGGGAASGAAWQRNAERAFCLGQGQGRSLMTQEEWREHRGKMRSLSAEERARYRSEWHVKMRERAREKNVELPAGPCPRAGGAGTGRGQGPGAGSGPKGPGAPQ